MIGREEVQFSSGGERCAAWLYRPEIGSGPAPCVVMGSGLSCVCDQGLGAFAAHFGAAGIAALTFDYRHFGESDGEPRGLMSAARQREDFRAALSFAESLDFVDGARIALWGYSLGGGHVQALAAGRSGLGAAICVVPIVNGLHSLAHISGPMHPLRLAAAGLRDATRALRHAEPHRIPACGAPGSVAILNSPDSAPGFAAITPPGSSWRNEICARAALAPPYRLQGKTAQISCPILYAISEQDDINPPALGIAAAQRAPRGELRLYPGGHFDPFLGPTSRRMIADQVAFLKHHLSPTPA